MYLLEGNAAANASLPLTADYVIWSAPPGSPRYTGRNPAERVEIKPYYIITRETLAHKSIYNHLTKVTTVDEIINANALKAPRNAKSQRLRLPLMQTQ